MPILKFILLLLLPLAMLPAASVQPPKMLFIYADDWGFGDLGYHGNQVVETPHLDRLASQGTEFMEFTAASGVSSPCEDCQTISVFHCRCAENPSFSSAIPLTLSGFRARVLRAARIAAFLNRVRIVCEDCL